MSNYLKRTLVSAIVLASVANVQAGPLELYMQQYQEKNTAVVADSIKEQSFKQLIDHNNPGLGQFSQRYFIDETYGKSADSPVFLYICGEAACSENALSGAIRAYAQKHKAKLVALEHRYYGKSMPMSSLTTDDLRYLSSEAALDDLAYFQRRLSNEKNWTGKWVSFGGSYAGALSAWYRLKFPYLVAGALSSSGPVKANDNFIEYDAHVTSVLPSACTDKVRAAVAQVEAALDKPDQMKKIKSQFAAEKVNDNIDFLYLMADVAAASVQYGMSNSFCKSLSSGSDPMKGYGSYAKSLYAMYGVTALQLTAQGAMSTNPADYKSSIGLRQWYYQSCKEFGYWQNAHPDSALSTRSSLINMDYHQGICQRLFGLTEAVDPGLVNNTYYYPLMDEQVTRIYFTNGGNDPWSNLSLTDKNGNTENANLSYELINGASHCDDLRNPLSSDSAAMKNARLRMDGLLTEWLRD